MNLEEISELANVTTLKPDQRGADLFAIIVRGFSGVTATQVYRFLTDWLHRR
jgi:hypothetical protein